MKRALHIGVALAIATGCHSQSMPVRLQGDPVSIAWLAGAWTGEYWGGVNSRGGSLAFTLKNGTDSLYGDVTMMGSNGQPLRAADPSDVHRVHAQSAQQLRIGFVAAEGNSVRGALEPYTSPDCECVLATTFVGQVHGDALTGTFETRRAGRVIAEGQWEMRRVGD
jgi:hypothetical protein